MGSLLSPSQECHPFTPSYLAHDLVVSPVMLIHILGKEFVVWDKSAHIDFIKPSQGTVTARFLIKGEHIENIINNTSGGQKYFPEFSVDIENEAGEKVARVIKTLYIRKKSLK
jgi:hypothetical protein